MASDDGRKRMPVLPPLQVRANATRRSRQRIVQAVNTTLDTVKHSQWHRPSRRLSLNVDQQVISHLRKKLVRRLEKRLYNLDEIEDENAKIARRSSASVKRKTATPKDIFEKYTEFGEKLVDGSEISSDSSSKLQPLVQSASTINSVANQSEADRLENGTPLPEIPGSRNTSAKSASTRAETGNQQSSRQSRLSKGTGSAESIPVGGSNEDTPDGHPDYPETLEREASLFNLTKVVVEDDTDLEISPVATPVMFRPMTREETRLTFEDRMSRVLKGQVHVRCPPYDRVLKLYVSSGFTDTGAERTLLIERVYPVVKQALLGRGYELEVYDLHWPLQDHITDDHRLQRLCEQNLTKAKESPFGTCFLLLLGEKYGPYLLPPTIDAGEFEAIIKEANDERARQMAVVAEKAAELEAAKAEAQQQRQELAEAREALEVPEPSRDTPSPQSLSPGPWERASSASRLKQQADQIRQKAKVVKFLQEDQTKTVEKINEALDSSVLRAWYKLDTNTVPSVYRLQNISTHLKDFAKTDSSKKQQAKNNWTTISRRLSSILQTMARKTLHDPAPLRKYFQSLLALEVELGVAETDEPNDRCLVIRRTLENLKNNLADTKVKDYLDMVPKAKKPEVDGDIAERMREIRDVTIPEQIEEDRIKDFRVSWTSSGLMASGHRGHHLYLERMAQTVTDHLLTTLCPLDGSGDPESGGQGSGGPGSGGQGSDHHRRELYDEVSHHVRFCQQSAVKFHGRKEILMHVKSYLRSPANAPLVVHGAAGTGKTSLLAKAANDVHRWFQGWSVTVMYRAVGLSERSTNVRLLLHDLCRQMGEALGMNNSDLPLDAKGIMNDFLHKLSHVPDDRHVILVLDSLEGLSDENEGRKLQWLPKELSPNVHIVLSTLPDEKYGCLKSLRNTFPPSSRYYLELGELGEQDAIAILDKWFYACERVLTDDQYELLLEAFRKCPTPLFLDTAFRETLSWTSYLDAEQTKLGDTVKKVATIKFGKLEKDFGEPLVRRALGYITASRDGVSSNEMEDLLSLDEAVMEDVKRQMTLPSRRLPPALWLSLRDALGDYLILCRTGGNNTLRWRHVQFHDAAEERYLLARDRAASYHKTMSEYFMGTWSTTPKPHPGNETGSLRHVVDQSLYLETEGPDEATPQKTYNARRMRELPHHLLNSQQTDVLKATSLCNFEYMLAKLLATSLRALLEEYHIALRAEPSDADLKLLSDTLQLSQHALGKDPRQLGAQIAGRLNGIVARDVPATAADPFKYPFLKDLLVQITKASIPTLLPSVTCLTEPGGVLFDLLCGHSDAITAATLTTDGMKLITTSKDDTMKLWDLRSGRVVRTIDGVGRDVLLVKTGMANSLAITSQISSIRIWSMRTGALIKTISGFDDPAVITTANEGRLLVAVFDGVNTLRVWDLENNFKQLHEIDINHAGVHQDNSAIVAGNPYGNQILFGARGTKEAYLQNARSGRLLHTIRCHDKSSLLSCLAITRDYLVLGCRQPYMKLHEIFVLELFDVKRGTFQRNVRGCVHDNVHELVINQIGSHAIAVCSSEQNNTSDIALWNLETEDHKHLARHADVSRICVCLDFRYCLTAAKHDKTLRIWNISGKVNLPAPKMKTFNGVGEIVPMVSNPRYVVAKAVNNGPLSVWNVVKAKCLQNAVRIERGLVDPSDVLLVRNSKIVILTDRGFSSVSDDSKPVFQTVLVYNLKSKKYERKLTGLFITPSPSHEYVLLEDDLLMGLNSNRTHFVVWSLQTGHVVQRIRTNFKEFERQRLERGEAPPEISAVKRATTAKMLAWDKRSESKAARHKRHEKEKEEELKYIEDIKKEKDNSIDQYIISGDYSVLVASFFAHHLCVFDMPSHSHRTTLENYSSMLFLYTAALTFSGDFLAQANYDERTKTSYVTLWDCNTGQVKRRLKNEPNVCAIAVTNDGERVVFGKTNNELRIWDPMRQNSVRRIKGYPGLNFEVESKIFVVENDSRALVFAGDISLWDLENASVLAVFTPDMRIQCCTVALDGKVIAFGLLESTDVVVLKLASKDILPLQDSHGEELFGETTGDTSDEDDGDDDG